MEIILGNDRIDISDISVASIDSIDYYELNKLELKVNGEMISVPGFLEENLRRLEELRYFERTGRELDGREEYEKDKEKKKVLAEARNAARELFMQVHKDKSVLTVYIRNSRKSKKYVEGFCGFDIFEKEKEIEEKKAEYSAIQRKKENSNNDGERTVEYAIKWFVAAHENPIVSIAGDCESKHRYNCILLNKPDFIDDPQEYDHILVCSAGIIIIETKHWKGNIEILPDGQWARETEEGIEGAANPEFQMRRHELMLKNIIPDVEIYSLLCFSNSKIIITGKDNFTAYPIVTVDQLEETLSNICSNEKYDDAEISKIVDIINKHKVNCI